MFESFYGKYLSLYLEDEMYHKLSKGNKNLEIAYSFLTIAFAAVVVVAVLFREVLICIYAMVPFLFAMSGLSYHAHQNTRQLQDALLGHQCIDDAKRRLELLENLLKSPEFGLYNVDGIEFLLKCCERELSRLDGNKKSIGTILLSLVSGAFGGIASNADISAIFVVTFGLAVVLTVIHMLYWNIENSVRSSNRKGYDILQNDLEYIKFQIRSSPSRPSILLTSSFKK